MTVEPTRVLVTGVGGPAGIALIRAFLTDPSVDPLAADIDPYAAGFYLVDPSRRWLVPRGDADDFVDETLRLCQAERVDVLVPTVDSELQPLAAHRSEFAAAGIRLALTTQDALAHSLDKLALAQRCQGHVRTPRTEVLSRSLDPASWTYPVVIKPRRGSGSRSISIVESAADLVLRIPDPAMLVQEYLPGEEYSLDVLADVDTRVVAVVPRARLRVDSGVSVAGRTLHDPELNDLARAVVAALGLTLVANVQCRRDADGRPALLEVNPRFPGAMALTVHSGVDLPRLCLDAVLGKPLPYDVFYRDATMVRYLDERFLDGSEVVRERDRVAA